MRKTLPFRRLPEGPYMDSSSVCKHSVSWRWGTTAHVYPASNRHIVATRVDPDGLFARQLPIASACFSHVDILGFCRRRFDLFAIVWIALQS